MSMEHIAHRVYENALWFAPCERLFEAVIPEARRKGIIAI
jgi:hypothetical protein